MKIKLDFITNSSSTAFIIQNTSNKDLNLTDFVLENLFLLDDWKLRYNYHEDDTFTPTKLLESAAHNNVEFPAGESKRCIFGDESETIVGQVYDYMLREGGTSKSFKWRFQEWLR